MPVFSHMDGEGHPWMVDVGDKERSDRTALAEGWVLMSREVLAAVSEGRNRKGDPLQVAEVAGVAALKRTSDLIPLCHPLRLDHGSVVCRIDPDKGVHITCRVRARDVTGVEMEALTGVSVAALTLYDMCKSMDKGMEIAEIRLMEKTGGKSGDWRRATVISGESERCSEHLIPEFRAGVLTVSDKGSVGERVDTSGPAIAEMVSSLGFLVEISAVVPDEPERIADIVRKWSDELDLQLILITGGTGLSPRDVTPEAVLSVADREVPGFGERMRSYSLSFTDRAILTRGLAATRGGTLIVSLPGSRRGAIQCLRSIESVLVHGVETLRGLSGECGDIGKGCYRKE